MYRRAKFVEMLIEIRQEMAHEADYDVELFAENARHGSIDGGVPRKKLIDPSAIKTREIEAVPLRIDKDAVA